MKPAHGCRAWKAFHEAHRDDPRAWRGGLERADAVVFGTPARFGSPASQLRVFIDMTGGLWFQGWLADKGLRPENLDHARSLAKRAGETATRLRASSAAPPASRPP